MDGASLNSLPCGWSAVVCGSDLAIFSSVGQTWLIFFRMII